MIRMSAKAVFDNNLKEDELLITRAVSNLPKMFAAQYRRNVAPITPKKSGALRRSIITQVSGKHANIGWRLPYAKDQNEGVDSVTGRVYRNYTTPGTGPHFKDIALAMTIRQLDPMFRETGLTK